MPCATEVFKPGVEHCAAGGTGRPSTSDHVDSGCSSRHDCTTSCNVYPCMIIYTHLYIYISYIYIYTYLYNIIELRWLCQDVHLFFLFFSWSWAQEKLTPVERWQPVARRNGGPCHARRPQPRRPQFCAGHHGGSHEAEHAIEGDPGSPWQWVDNMLTCLMFLLKFWMQVHISITFHFYI